MNPNPKPSAKPSAIGARDSLPIVARRHRLAVSRDASILALLKANENELGREDQITLVAIIARGVSRLTEYQQEWLAETATRLGLKVPRQVTQADKQKPAKDEVSGVRWRLPIEPPKAGRRVRFKGE